MTGEGTCDDKSITQMIVGVEAIKNLTGEQDDRFQGGILVGV